MGRKLLQVNGGREEGVVGVRVGSVNIGQKIFLDGT